MANNNTSKANTASKSTAVETEAKDNYVPKYKLSLWEQESHIHWNEEEKEASFFTYNKAKIKRLDKLCQEFPEDYRLDRIENYGKYVSKFYTMNKKYISFSQPRAKRILSEEQRSKNIKQLQKFREDKNKLKNVV